MNENCKIESCTLCINRSQLFNLMTKKELELIEETRCEVKFKPDEIIYKQGTKTNQIVSVTGGLAKAYLEGSNGKNYILELIKPTTLISGPGTYVDNKHHFSLKAIEETSCCFFDLKTFKEIISKNSKLSDLMIQSISKRVILYFHKFTSLTQKQVNGRIAENLLYLHNDIYKSNPMNVTISYLDIAEMTGMSKDTAVRVLKDFSNEKIIEIENTTITILDLKKLNQISELG